MQVEPGWGWAVLGPIERLSRHTRRDQTMHSSSNRGSPSLEQLVVEAVRVVNAPVADYVAGSQGPGARPQPAAVYAAVYAPPYFLRALGAVPARTPHGFMAVGHFAAEVAGTNAAQELRRRTK